MGCWDVFCVLCGNSYTNYDYISELDKVDDKLKVLQKKMNKETKWLSSCVFLTLDNKIIHNCKELECNIRFGNGKKDYGQVSKSFDVDELVLFFDNENGGIFVHTDCWKYVYQTRNIKLKYGDLPINRFKLPKK